VALAALLSAALLQGAATGEADLSPAELAGRAESEFREGVRLRGAADQARPHFRAAAEYFDALRRQGAGNPILFRDLGNAYLLAGDLPRAVLSYRRGLDLAPHDAALRQALAEARSRVVYPEHSALGRPPADLRPPWLPRPRPAWLFAAVVALYGLGWVGLTRWHMTRRGRPLALGATALLAALLLGAFLFIDHHLDARQAEHPLVVIAEDGVLLRKGNGLAFPPRFDTPLNRGVEARLLFERGGWLQIELAGGEVGWVPRAYTLVDE
jgi:hypothetical protein